MATMFQNNFLEAAFKGKDAPQPQKLKRVVAYSGIGNKIVQEHTDCIAKAFEKIDAWGQDPKCGMGSIRKTGNRWMFQRFSEGKIENILAKRRRLEAERQRFLNGPATLVDKMRVVLEPAKPVEIVLSKKRATSVKAPKAPLKPLQVLGADVKTLYEEVVTVAIQRGIRFELIGKRKSLNRCKVIGYRSRNYVKVETQHEFGRSKRFDVRICKNNMRILDLMARIVGRGIKTLDLNEFGPGSSGIVLNREVVADRAIGDHKPLFVIRGRANGKLVNSLARVSLSLRKEIIHYTSVPEIFWKGYNTTHQQIRSAHCGHTCRRELDLEECGSITAKVMYALFPMWKVTCGLCRANVTKTDGEGAWPDIRVRLSKLGESVSTNNPTFTHVSDVIDQLLQPNALHSEHLEICGKIHEMIGGREKGIFEHLNELNHALVSSEFNSKENAMKCANTLFALVKWQMSKTESVKAGSVESFRNKAASKAHINVALMCDNQLDINGNFEWGTRGYHARRFFANYFNKIESADDYTRYAVRTNGSFRRKLAIGRLIVPLDLTRFRKHMQGELVQKFETTKKCIVTRNGDYAYTCCCVTQNDGAPLYSDILLPTKNHLVIGNTGDSKFVDLPANKDNALYIARDGYCYINIFLAMLVNVSEGSAKDFTKMVRDTMVPMLGKWPTMNNVATVCHMLSILYPDVRNAELPRILVDHEHQTMHVVDSFGSLSTGYHILKAGTVNQLVTFSYDDTFGDMKSYIVGGDGKTEPRETVWFKLLLRGIYNGEIMKQLLEEQPFVLFLSMVSPGTLMALYNSGSLEKATRFCIKQNQKLGIAISLLESLAQKVSRASLLVEQMAVINAESSMIFDAMTDVYSTSESYSIAINRLRLIIARNDADDDLVKLGFRPFDERTLVLIEKNYLEELETVWQELTWRLKLRAIWQSSVRARSPTSVLRPIKTVDLKGRYDISLQTYSHVLRNKLGVWRKNLHNKYIQVCNYVMSGLIKQSLRLVWKCVPDFMRFVNMLFVISLLFSIAQSVQGMAFEYRRLKRMDSQRKTQEEFAALQLLWEIMKNENGGLEPTFDEFLDRVKDNYPHLVECAELLRLDAVQHQAKSKNEITLERVIAISALVMMVLDNERSDALYKSLNKLKSLVATAEEGVHHQGLDDIRQSLDEENLTINIDLETDQQPTALAGERTFETWWNNQIVQNRTVPHYRIGGKFLEFTRDNAAKLCNDISHGPEKEFLIRGAVGSGKSTGIPNHLFSKGRVLLVEPTRPLAENVCKQLKSAPFHLSPSLRMRGLQTFGSTAIDVMTSGYALQVLAHNVHQIEDYKFIVFDECHVVEANAMALYCLLHEYNYSGKILKVSATPAGRECEFKTQFPVSLSVEETLSFDNFVRQQGSGSNADVISKGNNILVYVSSYNEVDMLSKLLIDKNFLVSKVDGRTMKVGQVEIVTRGTNDRKHFVVATNIIENGVTLDIDVVVDFGLKVEASLDVDNRCIRYTKKAISYGERIQRLGRVGRVREGHALRIGTTEKGISEIPSLTATEAAFLCFAFGLPVMTHNVSSSILGKCTVPQARTMLTFELSPFFVFEYTNRNGIMHPKVHDILKQYKLRECDIILNKVAIPAAGVSRWMSVLDYKKTGVQIECSDDVRIPFYVKGLPEKLLKDLWTVVVANAPDAGIGRMTSASACKISYTLQTDIHAIPRTIAIIDRLIEDETTKHNQFQALNSVHCASGSFSLAGITNMIRRKYMKDHSNENILKLQYAKAQILEFQNIGIDPSIPDLVQPFSSLRLVEHQGMNEVAKDVGVQGRWNKSLVTNDVLLMIGFAIGGSCLLYAWFKDEWNRPVHHQGFNKRQRQKLKFRATQDRRMGYEIDAHPEDLEHYFGSAYNKKKGQKGSKRGMGAKTRRFVNVYGFDPTEYSLVRYLDPLTGTTLDENPMTDMSLVQSHFGEIRNKFMEEDLLDIQAINSRPGLEAYYMKNGAKELLKIDLTPHNPLLVCNKTSTIAGFPEREKELRQTGVPMIRPATELPTTHEVDLDTIGHEGRSLHKGLRDYNPIAQSICYLSNDSDGSVLSFYGIGYGPYIITNRHLFKNNNGVLAIKTHHGEFTIKNTTSIAVFPVPNREIVIMRTPKDFPPFPMKLRFREPLTGESVCMVGSLFQSKNITSTVSETSATFKVANCNFFSHYITTKVGYCGLPLVSPRDGQIVGIHSAGANDASVNYMTAFPNNFESDYLRTSNVLEWTTKWRYNANEISWGSLRLTSAPPEKEFKPEREVFDFTAIPVHTQGVERERWLANKLDCNLKAVAYCENHLITKHVIRGKCAMFDLYLRLHPEAAIYFEPFTGHYMKSALNRDAYFKDINKYSSVIEVGVVNTDLFEQAESNLIKILESIGFGKVQFVTDAQTILDSLNMNAAVGTLYRGKKKTYFEKMTIEEIDVLIRKSCLRLYKGDMGIWNGSLKAELRPKEKVLANKTRTFTAAPIETLLGAKVCVDDFNNRFYDLHMKGPWTVGMTKFYGQWDELLRLLPDGWLYCDADGSQFDSSLSPYLINAVVNIRLHFMEEWDIGKQMLQNLYTEIVYTPISTPDGTVVKKYKGNNSGQPSTVVDNSLMVCLAVQYALVKAGVSYEDGREKCVYFSNGDDLIIALSPEIEHVLNTFKDSFIELGLKYDFNNRTRNRGDLWFLSHKGVEQKGKYIPKLEKERIVSILEWDRSAEPRHRLEAICASMIEAWGYDDLLHEIRKFYDWLISQAPYNQLADVGMAPYIAESALKNLYTGVKTTSRELERYMEQLFRMYDMDDIETEALIHHQGDNVDKPTEVDAGTLPPDNQTKNKDTGKASMAKDKDVDAGSSGVQRIPRLSKMMAKMRTPKTQGKEALDLSFMLTYLPDQVNLSNTRATQEQYEHWRSSVQEAYGVTDEQMKILLVGLTVWCIENGTSPDLNGMWTMMDGSEQVSYPLQPIIENAKPTFRQIMAHHSDVAEAYIEMRNSIEPYMPRYGLQRNLKNYGLARYAFDFFEITSKTPKTAREAHFQMKAAALRNVNSKMFGLDGKVGNNEENTERHTSDDVTRDMHSLLGVRNM